MRRWIYGAVMLAAMATFATAGDLNSEEQNFLRQFESFRARYKLAMPVLDNTLVDGSRQWSVRMRQSGRFAHGASRENIYRGSESGMAAFRAWERSSGHRALLLSPNIDAFGIGNSGTYWTFRAKSKARESVTKSTVAVERPAVVVTEQRILTRNLARSRWLTKGSSCGALCR